MLTTQKIQIYYYFEFPTRHPYKICWFEFWGRRPKRLATRLVAATAARFRGNGGRGGGDHGGEGRGGGGLCGGGVAAAGSAGAAAAATAAGVLQTYRNIRV